MNPHRSLPQITIARSAILAAATMACACATATMTATAAAAATF